MSSFATGWLRTSCLSLLLSSTCLLVQSCSANNGEGPITAQDKAGVEEGIKSADETPIVALEPAPQTFSFKGHKFTIHAEPPLKLQARDHGNSKSFAFLGPERKDLGQNVFSVIIVNGDAEKPAPTKAEMMDGMLHPFRQRLTGYKELPFSLELSDGKTESGTEFSGSMFGAGKLHGFVVTIPVKNGVYSLTTTDREEQYGQSIEKIKSLAKTIKIAE